MGPNCGNELTYLLKWVCYTELCFFDGAGLGDGGWVALLMVC